jgi:transcriptional regulator with XRE-family HTH domain
VVAASLRRAREQAGLSQRHLAAVVGVSRSAVQMWERAARAPDGEHWVQLELTLGPLGVVRDRKDAATREDDAEAA